MSYIPALDISQYQGAIDFSTISEPIIIMKIGGGDNGLYYDSQASRNYSAAKAAGKNVGLYWFLGPGDPTTQADFFLRGCKPLEEADVLVLDFEIETDDPVGRCYTFLKRLIDSGAPIPMIYMDTDRENRFDWLPVINLNVALWVADYRYTPEENVPVRHWPTYVMHQYSSSPIDHDAFFGTINQFRAYGWVPTKPAGTQTPPADIPAVPDPTPAPVVVPAPVTPPTVVPAPKPVVAPPVEVTTPYVSYPPVVPQGTTTITLPNTIVKVPVKTPKTVNLDWLERLLTSLLKLLHRG